MLGLDTERRPPVLDSRRVNKTICPSSVRRATYGSAEEACTIGDPTSNGIC